jgi:HAD superfamily phosphoserine phosphatase-like hydrolase
MKIKFLFDLDGTLTKTETLPLIAETFGLTEDIGALTRETIAGNVPFVESFIQRVNLLKQIPHEKIAELLSTVRMNEWIEQFIEEHKNDCVVVTGNCDKWIENLVKKLPCDFRSSTTKINRGAIELVHILKKEEVVDEYKRAGYFVVFVGDGNNDAEAMRRSDLSIGCGIIHMPASSVLSCCDYAIFDEVTLYRQLKAVANPSTVGVSVVLSCAGVGSRIGLGVTKALLKIGDESLIRKHLKNFSNIEDLRIVVGFQASKIIEEVLRIRRSVVFVFNHDYFHTKTGFSYYLGARHANRYVIEWDGDLVVHPRNLEKLLTADFEYVAGTAVTSEDPMYVEVRNAQAVRFATDTGNESLFEWTGPCLLLRENISNMRSNVFDIINPILPLPFMLIEAYDIDTHEDYARVKRLVQLWK